ncbi:SGNH/GDSL hydrolase family protein [Novosphingobium soli]|uniref:SGNH/GDSL hydrolase family protein n=1 Tax=Novosphingobium soli TaxID=574956 RepID=A0ABV6D198_9SPHN
MAIVPSKLVRSTPGDKVLDADQIEETADALLLRAAERVAVANQGEALAGAPLVYIDRVPNAGSFAVANDTGFAVAFDSGADVDVGDLVEGFALDLAASAGTVSIHAELFVRSQVDGLPSPATDTLLAQFDVPLAMAGLTAGGPRARVFFLLPSIARFLAGEGKSYLATVRMLDGNAVAVPLGIGRNDASGFVQRRRGYYFRSDNQTWNPNAETATWTGALFRRKLTTAAETSQRIAQAEAGIAGAASTATKARTGMGLSVTGRAAITSSSLRPSNSGLFIPGASAAHSGWKHTMLVRNPTNVAKTFHLTRVTSNGAQFVPVPGAGYTPVEVPAGPATYAIPISYYIPRGETPAFSVPAGVLGFAYDAPGVPDDTGYYYHNVPQPAAAFVPSGGKQTGIQLQIGLIGDYALAHDDVVAIVQPQIDAQALQLASTKVEAGANTAALNQIIEAKAVEVYARSAASAYVNFATGTPDAKAWAVPVQGSSIPAGTLIARLVATFHRAAGIVAVEAMLYSRDAAKLTAPDNADTAEWAAWVSVAATGVAEGNFGDVEFIAPNVIASVASRGYYLRIRARDADGNLVSLGYGRAAGAGTNQMDCGWYLLSSGAWSPIGLAAVLAIRVKGNQTKVKQSALPDGLGASSTSSSAPSKKRGMVIMLGRSELPFDNTAAGGVTMRRVFAGPANSKRVTQVIFSHSTTTPQEITRAAIAPLASATNFAATGVAWTPLSFGPGVEKGIMPAAASSQRYGMLASRPFSLDLAPRTDVPGAAKLMIISAYMGVSGSPMLLGKAGTDDYKTNWEARADFPSVMRHNAGDCVTTPANFTSTANDINGTCIAGVVIECDDGELVTIMFPGDSISNGAGITGPNGVLYGQGWAETLAYGMNTRRRGVLPVLLGWSGQNMSNIRYNAVDFYAFVKANGLPAPNVLYTPNASPNSMSTPLTKTSMDAQRPLSDEIVGVALGAGSQVVKWLCLPVDPSVKDLDQTPDPNDGDKFRRNYNDADRAEAALQRGAIIADYDAAVTLGFDGDGQALFNDDYEDDSIHPNAAGHALMAAIGERASRLALPAAGYAVGGLVT